MRIIFGTFLARLGRRIAASLGYGALAVLVNATLALAPSLSAPGDTRIVVLGYSITAGLGLSPDRAFPALLEDLLRAEGLGLEIANAGASGDTTAGGLARLARVLAHKPDIVIVALGSNDALRGLPPRQALVNLDAIIRALRAEGIAVLLAGAKAPPNFGRDYQAEFDAIFPRLAQAHDVPLYPFILDGVAADRALNQADGIHPNEQGAAIIARGIAPALRSLVIARRAAR